MPGWINLFSGHSNPAGWPLGGAFAWATTGYRSPSARYAPAWRRFILKLKRK